jgi:hypothetical protein
MLVSSLSYDQLLHCLLQPALRLTVSPQKLSLLAQQFSDLRQHMSGCSADDDSSFKLQFVSIAAAQRKQPD